ncbi:hypothetical protein GDO78_014830 [Eleutherodactylus coqui]|uniref:Uncharacterized protein n=1 Tax=Eleutherodactylus coqui TaxID=57060 RepID=A0A8J6BEK3_ELECQ|nr:hypothetical protein GDO78_014830 [Eleutherodactylus coqui]
MRDIAANQQSLLSLMVKLRLAFLCNEVQHIFTSSKTVTSPTTVPITEVSEGFRSLQCPLIKHCSHSALKKQRADRSITTNN